MIQFRSNCLSGGGISAVLCLEKEHRIALEQTTEGWPSLLPHVCVYPTTSVDRRGRKLSRTDNDTLIFARGQLPPVNPLAFWPNTASPSILDGSWQPPSVEQVKGTGK